MSGLLLDDLSYKKIINGTGAYHQITGLVKQVSGKRRVFLLDKASMQLLDATWSDNVTGAYAFYYLEGNPRKYLVLAVDHVGDWNAEAVDTSLTWVPM